MQCSWVGVETPVRVAALDTEDAAKEVPCACSKQVARSKMVLFHVSCVRALALWRGAGDGLTKRQRDVC